ncbi:MFS transporter [Pelagibacterium sp. 26DY04]|uniref:MFS transporter n=1 Tax=Pelagibacterium sp. 26DY04 TaxID=2967130 RepID=UPI0028159AD5|nr:MFS transporter [Pelagibacterium sp. 26DY04]WMT86619.1 MFS transporter [Pelagibacterium sp. 26DY04]
MSGRRGFYSLVLAEVCSISGTRLSMIAIPWLVLTMTGDPVLTGVVAFAEMAPYVIAKALGGPLLDRLGARRVSIVGDFASVGVVAAVPVLDHFELLAVPLLIALMAILGALRGPADAAKQAMIPSVAREGKLPLERVTGIMGTIERLASTIGAAAAGALVAVIGPAQALAFNGICLAVAAIVLLAGTRSTTIAEAGVPQSYGRQFAEGFDFLRKDAVLVGIAVMVALTNFIDQAFGVVLVPVWAAESGRGAAAIGLVLAVFSGFSILGSAVATAFAEKLPRLAVYIGAFVLVGLPRFVVFAFDAPLAAILAVLAVGGFASGFLNPIISAVILERIPEKLVGRVSSLVTASAWALMPFGGIVGGVLIAGIGLEATLLILGFVYLAITLAPLGLKRFRGFARRPEVV